MTNESTCKILPGVELGENCRIEDYSIIGVLPRGASQGSLETRVGADSCVRSHTVIYAGNVIGSRFQTGHGALIRESNQIGDDVSIGSHSVVEHHVQIRSHARIHSNAFVPEYSVLEEYAWVGPNVVLTNARYPRSRDVKSQLVGAHIKFHAKIGANTTLLPGVVIGRYALVGAGSVVVHDVPDYKVVAGNPARIVNDIRKLDVYEVEELTKERQP